MKTKVAYALSSDEGDMFLEQLLLSIHSLRKSNPSACIELLVDANTMAKLKEHRASVLKRINNVIVVDTPFGLNKAQVSRWLKTNLRQYVNGDYIFLDNDTIVTDDLSDIDSTKENICGVYDGHLIVHINDGRFLTECSHRDGWRYFDGLEYFNSGVFYVKDNETTRAFYDRWHENWKLGLEKHKYYKDQSSLALTNEQFSYLIKPLGGEWNCQVLSNGLPFLHKAKIIHYFANSLSKGFSPTYDFLDKNLFLRLKETMEITPEIDLLIENAKGAFAEKSMVVSGFEKELVVSDFANICRRYPSLFRFINSVCRNSIMLRHHLKTLLGHD